LQTFDAIVLDAGGGGIEALLEIRARGSVVPVLIASGDIIEGNFGEPTRVLMKPFHLHELDHQLATLAALGRRAGPSTD
jgi:DNA-binding response OmpR family regulator